MTHRAETDEQFFLRVKRSVEDIQSQGGRVTKKSVCESFAAWNFNSVPDERVKPLVERLWQIMKR